MLVIIFLKLCLKHLRKMFQKTCLIKKKDLLVRFEAPSTMPAFFFNSKLANAEINFSQVV